MRGLLGTYPFSTELVYSLVFHTITSLESTGLEHWEVFQMVKLGEKKTIVDLVANRGSFKRNYWGGRRIPGSYRRGGTEMTWGSSDVLEITPLESNP